MANWMAGKKTYLLAGAVILASAFLLFAGRMNVPVAQAIFLIAMAGFGVTFRSALARHQVEELAMLRRIAEAGMAYRRGDMARAAAEGLKAAKDLEVICTEVGPGRDA